MARIRRRAVLWLPVLVAACQPKEPGAPKVVPPSRFERLGDGCECAVSAAAMLMEGAHRAMAGEAPLSPRPSADLGTCSTALAKSASLPPKIDGSATPVVTIRVESLRLTSTGEIELCPGGAERALSPVATAFREAMLTSQACHSVAMAVALDAAMRDEIHPSEAALVARVGGAARTADRMVALCATYLHCVASLKRVNDPPAFVIDAVQRFRSLVDDGSFASDGASAFKRARRLTKGLGAAERRAYGESRRAATSSRPVATSGTPWLSLLLRQRSQTHKQAITRSLEALLQGDMGQIMSAAPALYKVGSEGERGLSAAEALLAGDHRKAAKTARELIPFFGDAAKAVDHVLEALP